MKMGSMFHDSDSETEMMAFPFECEKVTVLSAKSLSETHSNEENKL